MTTKRIILVAGATGKQGSALVQCLLQPTQSEAQKGNPEISYTVYALTRNPAGSSAKTLLKTCQSPNLHIVQGDLDNPDSIRKVFQTAKDDDHEAGVGIWGVYAVMAFQGLGNSAEPERVQGKSLADLALEFGVGVFVYSSSLRAGPQYDDAEHLKPSPLAKLDVENYLKELGAMGLKWVIMRPAFFMENFDGFIGSVAFSILKQGLKFDTDVALISSEDIGKVAAGVFKNHERYIKKTLAVSSDCLTMFHLKTAYRDVTGIPIPDIPSFSAWLLIKMNKSTQDLLEDIEQNHHARASGAYPELEEELALARSAAPMKTYAEWLKREKTSEASTNWNEVSIWKLVTGRM